MDGRGRSDRIERGGNNHKVMRQGITDAELRTVSCREYRERRVNRRFGIGNALAAQEQGAER